MSMIRKTNEWKLPTEQLFRSDFVRWKHKRKKRTQTLARTHTFETEKNIGENFSAGFRDKIVRARSKSLSHSCESCQLPLYRWSPVGCVCSQKCIESNKFCVGKNRNNENRGIYFSLLRLFRFVLFHFLCARISSSVCIVCIYRERKRKSTKSIGHRRSTRHGYRLLTTLSIIVSS